LFKNLFKLSLYFNLGGKDKCFYVFYVSTMADRASAFSISPFDGFTISDKKGKNREFGWKLCEQLWKIFHISRLVRRSRQFSRNVYFWAF